MAVNKYTEARRRANEKYNAKAYDEIKVRVSKGNKEKIKEYAEGRGESLNGFINRAIEETIERDAAVKDPDDQRVPVWHVVAVEPHDDYSLIVTFQSGVKKRYDMRPLIEGDKAFKPYAPLKDLDFFMRAYVDGSVAWSDEIDIAPEELYDNGVAVDTPETA